MELEQECAGAAADVEDWAARRVATEETKLAFEAHGRVVAFEFVAGKVVRTAELIVVFGSTFGRQGIGVGHSAGATADELQRLFTEPLDGFSGPAHGAGPMGAVRGHTATGALMGAWCW